jgi:hypothetical protein
MFPTLYHRNSVTALGQIIGTPISSKQGFAIASAAIEFLLVPRGEMGWKLASSPMLPTALRHVYQTSGELSFSLPESFPHTKLSSCSLLSLLHFESVASAGIGL